jgi:hypothetical protein
MGSNYTVKIIDGVKTVIHKGLPLGHGTYYSHQDAIAFFKDLKKEFEKQN